VATCGGGGGGGLGGISPGAGEGTAVVYRVPWQVVAPGAPRATGALELLWFPTSPEEARSSGLVTSRVLSIWSGLCVGMNVVTSDNADLRRLYVGPSDESYAVLVAADGSELARTAARQGRLDTAAVEKMLRGVTDARQRDVETALDEAKAKQKAGEADVAAALYTRVWEQRCMVPGLGRKAARALRELGRPVPEESSTWEGPSPRLDDAVGAELAAAMEAGLRAEIALDLAAAQAHYERARALDPADPTPLRFLAELHRHHTGDWVRSRQLFTELLAMPADRLSRAVALHGLGKMTIHEDRFAEGLALIERSVIEYPLALAYRNLAVYWSSEGARERAWQYTERALALEPDDAYNQVFAATVFVAMGRQEEAAALARKHEGLLEASYNLAAIWGQLGLREEMLRLLRRHFYDYEQTDAVRAMEMQEAREDIVFAAYHADADFVRLTALARKHTPMGGR
jgi:tetratricopeptide (TPR) repeat protein